MIHGVSLSGGTPTVSQVPANSNGCDNSSNFGTCTAARFAVSEYSLTVPSSPALAIHVIDGLGSGESPAAVVSITDSSVDTTPAQNGGVIGASVFRSGAQSYVVASSAQGGNAGTTLTYGVPGTAAGRHVVFDAPSDGSGSSTVATSSANGRCTITITAGGSNAFTGQPLLFDVDTAANGCKATVSAAPPPVSAGPGNGGTSSGSGASSGGGTGSASASVSGKGGCSCDVVGGVTPAAGGLGLAGIALLFARRRRRR